MQSLRCVPVALLASCALLVCAAQARAHGWKRLKGKELLIVLERTWPGKEPPGLYAYDGKALFLVEPYAYHPKWSPSHKRLAFEQESKTGILDLATGGVRPTEFPIGYEDGPVVPASLGLVDAMAWMPDERAVVRWMGDPGLWADQPLLGVAPYLVGTDPTVGGSLLPVSDDSVGRVSFRPDSGAIAYEAFRVVPDVGTVDRRVLLTDGAGRASKLLAVEGFEGATTVNPLWSPDGRRLSVDCIRQDGTRATVILDTEKHTQTVLEDIVRKQGQRFDQPPERYWMHALEWSPSGEDILVTVSTPPADHGFEYMWLVRASANRDLTLTEVVSEESYAYRACWSPDGTRIAVLGGQERYARKNNPRVVICVPGGRGGYVPIPEGMRPTMIEW